MTTNPPINLWSSADHARDYLERADSISHRTEGEAALLEFIPEDTHRILDLGTGDGRLLALVKEHLARKDLVKKDSIKNDLVKNDPNRKDLIKRDVRRKSAKPDSTEHPPREPEAVAIDFSPSMLEAARQRFAADSSVTVISHNLDEPLTGLSLASLGLRSLGEFDAVISCFAIHHLVHERKRALYAEIHDLLNPGGVFCNLEHVSSPTPRLHEDFLHRIGYAVETEDPSNKLLDVETQLQWLRELGFTDVDCHWKWRELALLAGRKA
jgi:SAM-dependent methyltransferase